MNTTPFALSGSQARLKSLTISLCHLVTPSPPCLNIQHLMGNAVLFCMITVERLWG